MSYEGTDEECVGRYKLVLVGDGGVGKTTLVKRHKTGHFEKRYLPTTGVTISPLDFTTNYGKIIFDVWDTAGQEKFGGLRDGYYLKADCAIIMFDLTSKATYQRVGHWYDNITRIVGDDLDMVLVGNKTEVTDRRVKNRDISFHRRYSMKYIPISAKTGFQYEKPFEVLMRKVTETDDLEITDEVAHRVDEELDEETLAELNNGWGEDDFALPDDEED
ncbi:hypothetical protein PCE1_004361 [Barthelona sp. PCE]